MNEITTEKKDEAPPKAGDERQEGRLRLAWDDESGKWRLLPKSTPPEVNPFAPGYVVTPPFRTVEKKARRTKRLRHITVDANGVRLTPDGRVDRTAYTTTWQVFLSKAWGKGQSPIAHRNTRSVMAEKMFVKMASEDKTLSKFLDPNTGQPNPDMVLGMYVALWRKILSMPKVMGEFARRAVEDAMADPQGALERFAKMTGVPTAQVMMATTPDGSQFLKLNIFSADPTQHENVDDTPAPKSITSRVLPPE